MLYIVFIIITMLIQCVHDMSIGHFELIFDVNFYMHEVMIVGMCL